MAKIVTLLQLQVLINSFQLLQKSNAVFIQLLNKKR